MAADRLVSSFIRGEHGASPFDALRLIRLSHLHRPFDVLRFALAVLPRQDHGSPSSAPEWDAVADMGRAASECGHFHIADSMIARLSKQFPSSARTATLQGILLEAQGMYQRAMRFYMNGVAEQPMSAMLYKRQIAVLKTQLKWTEAVALTNYYLSLYAQDDATWAELCALCLRLGRFSHALFAASELVVIDPQNYAHHILLADVYATCGGLGNIEMARTHYIVSANQRPRANLRALYGIWLMCTMMVRHDEQTQQQRRHTVKCLRQAQEAIGAVYQSLEGPHSARHRQDVQRISAQQRCEQLQETQAET